MIDVRRDLLRSKTVPQVNRSVTKFLTVHYNGPSVGDLADITLLKADARFHVNTRGWDGLAYHYAVGRVGALYQTRDWAARLNHSGVPQGNGESLAVLVIMGEGDPLPCAQIAGLEQLIKELDIEPRWILGHQEWPRLTACPGALLRRWLDTYQAKFRVASETKTIVTANIRDEANVLSAKVGVINRGTKLRGVWMLGSPYKGDSLWFQIIGTTNFLHGSTVDTSLAPTWTR